MKVVLVKSFGAEVCIPFIVIGLYGLPINKVVSQAIGGKYFATPAVILFIACVGIPFLRKLISSGKLFTRRKTAQPKSKNPKNAKAYCTILYFFTNWKINNAGIDNIADIKTGAAAINTKLTTTHK